MLWAGECPSLLSFPSSAMSLWRWQVKAEVTIGNLCYLCCSVAQSCPTLCDPMDCSTPGFPSFAISQSLLKLISTGSVTSSNHFIHSLPLLLLPSVFSSIRVFSNESALHILTNFSISPSNEHPWLISFKTGWFDLLAVQGVLKSPPAPQFESIDSSVFNFLYGPTLTSIHDY